MKHMHKNISMLLVILVSILFVFVGCSDMMAKMGEIALHIELDNHEVSVDSYTLEGTLANSSVTFSLTVHNSSKVDLSSLQPGKWTFTAEAFDSGNIPIGTGTKVVDLKAGQVLDTTLLIVFTLTGSVSITGTAKDGVELTAGTLTPVGSTVSYQWTIATTSNGEYVDIAGATANKYTPVAGDVGKFIKVVATGTGNYSGTVTSSATAKVAALAIGDSYGGGIVAYILVSGDSGYDSGLTHGLIAATADQSAGIIWAVSAYQSTTVPGGATGTAIGTGLANTTAIIDQNDTGLSTYAAGLCDAYTNTETGTGVYTDWYLPSKDELYQLYLNQGAVGGFVSAYYWSSSEGYNNLAWFQNFYNGSQNFNYKDGTSYVRAVRAF